MHNKINQDGDVAILQYKDGNFAVIRPGTHVICAITGKNIPITKLCYWSVERQVPYADAESSLEAERRAGKISY
ncbi:MAG: DUF2093 domain-containing protein [Candidatus Liberibacter ctenarytainae]|uniref:DUF2093 domain-containing protein n=1 Tax=Candidatus Liberibacter ctenarytainae TaxID=2020335 RepID=A0A937DGM1_9HYPH|nr:DUF2093 domain-containing protein [Candidatus Liberibacter ctenarytainae]